MEPLSLGILGLLIYVGDKFAGWAIEKGFDTSYEEIIGQMEAKSPDVAKVMALPAGERQDIGEAVLVGMVEDVARDNPEIGERLVDLGNGVKDVAKDNSGLEKSINDLVELLKKEHPHIVNENWQGINFKNANPTISGNTFNFGK
ncbi:hypothetical protein [Brunnivagina elsteri]|uniref:Uncharacterized protein n=1 Tax=Brunnivagina elsteri CCALA 953 TaxID=987040 RepID=A0A2A2TP82_9CYAN|nr:hypothetical protein [Calothrix elsteri]PAX60321.1 hypothetical protein CK510_02450 [Calothrix elsteri CCALA 953]